jgi:GrpB-like predicted nucleotidyltransferase (UPF0157 family)
MKIHRTFTLEKYNQNWPQKYKIMAKFLKSLFGKEIVNIEHIGSTSIPGMLAKPQIDIQVEVKNLSNIKKFYKKMEENGFIAKGDYSNINEEYFTKDNKEGKRLFSIHVFQTGNPELFNHVNFRDYLIKNKEDRDLYISVKKDLYSKFSDNFSLYDNGKKDIIKSIMKRAEQWKKKNTEK